jgi:hypothetical protein
LHSSILAPHPSFSPFAHCPSSIIFYTSLYTSHHSSFTSHATRITPLSCLFTPVSSPLAPHSSPHLSALIPCPHYRLSTNNQYEFIRNCCRNRQVLNLSKYQH